MSYIEDKMEEHQQSNSWSESAIETLISYALEGFWKNKVEEGFFDVAVKFDEIEDQNINLQNQIDSIKDRLGESISHLEQSIKEISESDKKRIENKIKSGINSTLTLGQMAILIKVLMSLGIFTNSDIKIGMGLKLITGAGADSMRRALGMPKPSSDNKQEVSDENHYKNLNEVRLAMQQVLATVSADMSEMEHKIPLEDRIKI